MEPITTAAAAIAAYHTAKELLEVAREIGNSTKNFWDKVHKKKKIEPKDGVPSNAVEPLNPDAVSDISVESRLIIMQAAISELRNELMESSNIIKALADQNQLLGESLGVTAEQVKVLADTNCQLTNDIAVNRVKIKRLIVTCSAVAIVALSSLGVVVYLAAR